MKKEKIIVCPNDFNYRINNNFIDYHNRFYKLYENAVKNNGLTEFYDDIINKITKKKNNPKISLYRLLECFRVLSPTYSSNWLLYGETDTFLTRYETLKKNSIISKYYPEHKFIEIVNIFLIEDVDIINFRLKQELDEDFNISQEVETLCETKKITENELDDILYKCKPKLIYGYEIKELFLDHYASMNRLKKIIPRFNESWLMFGEGDMFENTDKLTEK